MSTETAYFAPQLLIPSGVRDISFYLAGLGAIELRRWTNNDGTIHVAELSLEGAVFHLHESRPHKGQLEPGQINGVTSIIGLFVADVDRTIQRAITAGAQLISPAQDYDYGYRQGEFKDPFGHHWLIQARL